MGLPVLELAHEAVHRCLAATGLPASLTTEEVVAAFTSERRLLVEGESLGMGFAPLSKFWPTDDGWVRTHANYPWHEAALKSAVGDDVGPALLALTAVEAQERIVAAGGVAAAVNDRASWESGPVAQAAALRPLVDTEALGTAPPREVRRLRVLDLTRVIAGPVCTRMLAALGADVLRIDPPSRPELPLHIADGLVGKRSAILDASVPAGRAVLHGLLHEADVVVCGYRPHALDRLRLAPSAIAYDHPGTVVVTISAWGSTGPWDRRRGFDSLVQAACGIALLEGDPGALPCQFLDHATGYLAAAGALEAVARQRAEGGTIGVWLSLVRTAQWLMEAAPSEVAWPAVEVPLQDLGGLEVVRPPGSLSGAPLEWPGDRPVYGGSEPAWRR